MDTAGDYEVLLTELKAGAVDVACAKALERGAEVVFLDNRAVTVDGPGDFESELEAVTELAIGRGGGA
jgi:predicted GTPase